MYFVLIRPHCNLYVADGWERREDPANKKPRGLTLGLLESHLATKPAPAKGMVSEGGMEILWGRQIQTREREGKREEEKKLTPFGPMGLDGEMGERVSSDGER